MAEMEIVMLTEAPYGGMLLTAPQWAGQVVGVRWEDAPGGQDVYAHYATRTTGGDTPGGQAEGLDLRAPESDGLILSVDGIAAGLYMVAGRNRLVPARLSPRGVIMRVRIDSNGIRRMDKGTTPFELTGGRLPGIGRDRSHWLMGAATAAGELGSPYRGDNPVDLIPGDYAVVSRRDGLGPVWLEIA